MTTGDHMRKALLVALTGCLAGAGALAQDREAISAGLAIYRDKCVDCHGPGLVPTGAGADLRELRAGDRAKFDQVLKEGRNQMPAWDGLLDASEIERLWAYIRSRAND